MLKTRLRRVEVEAQRLRDQRIEELLSRLTPDQVLVLAADLEAELLADDEQTPRDDVTAGDRARMTAKLADFERQIEEKEAAEPGFRQRVLTELNEIDDWMLFYEPRPAAH